MDKIKLLTYAVIGLLLLNVAIISFLFFLRPGRNLGGNHRRPKEIIAEKLHFDADQIEKYESVIPIYKDKIDSLDLVNRVFKSELYSQLKLPVVNTNIKDSIISLFLANQKHIEEAHFKHFQDIKSICNNTQLQDYYDLTQEFGKMFSNQNRKPHPPREKPPRNEDFPRPPREENQARLANDTNYPPPPPRNRNHPRPPRDENRPPPPHWNEDHPRHPGDENRPPPPPMDENN